LTSELQEARKNFEHWKSVQLKEKEEREKEFKEHIASLQKMHEEALKSIEEDRNKVNKRNIERCKQFLV
jgi:hypothetical protein